jgi:hypothetical protein
MFRLRTLTVLVGMVAALVISASPAFGAMWRANASATKENPGEGNVNVVTPGEFVDEGLKVKCPAKEIVATWSIQTKGQIKIHNESGKQLLTKEGPHLHIHVSSWGTCEAVIGATKVAVSVSGCELQLAIENVKSANGGVVTTCVIKAGVCEVQIPPGMETKAESNQGINVGLAAISLENKVNNQFDKINVTGITGYKPPNTPNCVLHSKQENAELKGAEFEIIGATVVQ